MLSIHAKLVSFYLYLHRIRRRVERDPNPHIDLALAPIDGELRPRGRIITGVAA